MPRPDRKRAAFALLVAGLFLAGCGGGGETTESSGDSRLSPSVPYSGVAVLPPGGANPDQLLGLDPRELRRRLGKPALIRRDGDAEVWQYRGERCVLDLFLYGSVKRVEHVDLRDRGDGNEAAARSCFIGMLRKTGNSS